MRRLSQYFAGCLIAWLVCLTALPAWAAITYVGGRVLAAAGTTSEWNFGLGSLTGGSDATPAVGDLVVVAYCTGSTVDRTLTIKDAAGGTDYTLIGSEQFGNDTNATNMRVAYKFMTGSVDTNVYFSETVTGGTGSLADAGTAMYFVLRGVNATPLEQAAQQGTGINTHLVDPGSITPTTTGTFIFVVGCGAMSTGGTYTQADLSDFKPNTSADTVDSSIGGGYLAWTSGAYSPATFAGGGSDTVSNSYAWTMVAFAPAAEAASTGSNNCGALMLLGVGGC